VITGVIKANFPARIAFQVASKVDSRTILDQNGAEKLLGRGDMLFLPPASPEPIRLHNAFISLEEIEAVLHHVNTQPAYNKTRCRLSAKNRLKRATAPATPAAAIPCSGTPCASSS
jgi:DNA segregation ATPase FtsK/SpoIIIE-like protein